MKCIVLNLFLGALILSSCRYRTEECDLVIHNATIYTCDGTFSTAEAMAIRDGKIVETGAERTILNRYKSKEVLDARKQYIYPGFIDAHSHFQGLAQLQGQLNLKDITSRSEIFRRVADAVASADSGAWITGRGWDETRFAPPQKLTRLALDSLAPNNPVLLYRVDGHAAWANTRALEAGNLMGTPLAPGVEGDASGLPSGIVLDMACERIEQVIPFPASSQWVPWLKAAEKACFAAGLTSVGDAGIPHALFNLYDSLYQAGELKIGLNAMLNPPPDNVAVMQRGVISHHNFRVGGVKLYADGALGSRGALLKEPYADSAAHYGLLVNDTTFLQTWMQRCYDLNYACNTHCIGDSANALVLRMYGRLLKEPTERRWRIEHAQVVSPKDRALFRAYSVIPSVQPTHAVSDSRWAVQRLGQARMAGAYAYRSLCDTLGLVALGTDFPVEDIDPLETFSAAVFRTSRNQPEQPVAPQSEALTAQQALLGMTLWAALAQGEDSLKGSLEPGKRADLVMLNADLLKVKATYMPRVSVQQVWVAGESVYRAP